VISAISAVIAIIDACNKVYHAARGTGIEFKKLEDDVLRIKQCRDLLNLASGHQVRFQEWRADKVTEEEALKFAEQDADIKDNLEIATKKGQDLETLFHKLLPDQNGPHRKRFRKHLKLAFFSAGERAEITLLSASLLAIAGVVQSMQQYEHWAMVLEDRPSFSEHARKTQPHLYQHNIIRYPPRQEGDRTSSPQNVNSPHYNIKGKNIKNNSNNNNNNTHMRDNNGSNNNSSYSSIVAGGNFTADHSVKTEIDNKIQVLGPQMAGFMLSYTNKT
jgi:hypothetical protein